MRRTIIGAALFLFVFIVYLGVATKFTYIPRWELDHLNPLAKALSSFRLDIPDPSSRYDLIFYKGRWYAPWGILAAMFLIPMQVAAGRYVPAIYLTVLFASINVLVVSVLLLRIRREFFPEMSLFDIFVFLTFFAFGTAQFYVGTLGSSWHVDQMVTTTFSILGIAVIFKKKRKTLDYLLSVGLFSITLLGRATMVLLVSIPAVLYLVQYVHTKGWSISSFKRVVVRGIVIFGLPLGLFSLLFFFYNYLRFENPFEYGYRYIQEAPYLASIRLSQGIMSWTNLRHNIWYFLFEVPAIIYDHGVKLRFSLEGNSIFFLSPGFFAIILAKPFFSYRGRFTLDPYRLSLWFASVFTMSPSLFLYSTGWMQFGYRYSLDIVLPLLLLCVFGMKGKTNAVFSLGVVFSLWIYYTGIRALNP